MAKRKEIKFQDRHGDLRGRQNGMEFWIQEAAKMDRSGQQDAPAEPPTEREEPPDVGI